MIPNTLPKSHALRNGAKVTGVEKPDGDPAAEFTAKLTMCRLSYRDAKHPKVIALANRLRAGKNDEQAAKAAFEYVVRQVPYVKDPKGYEFVQAPKFTLGLVEPYPGYHPQGDCDCQCTALGALIVAMGFQIEFRILAWRVDDYTHVNARVILPDGRRIPADPVMGLTGWGQEKRDGMRREKIFRCDMLVRTLEDSIAPDVATSAQRRPPTGQASGLSGCGCGCGGRSPKKKGCCPQNANRAANQSGGVVVNVSPNFGTQDSRRDEQIWLDNSRRSRYYRRDPRAIMFSGGRSQREVVTRQLPGRTVERKVFVDRAVAVPAPIVTKEILVPVLDRPIQATPSRDYKEFY